MNIKSTSMSQNLQDRNKFLSLTVVNSWFLRTVLYPFVLVKTRLQIQRQNTVYSGSLDAFKKIIRTEGFCGLYKGMFSDICYIRMKSFSSMKLIGLSHIHQAIGSTQFRSSRA